MNLLEGVSKLSKLLRQGLLDTNAKIFFDIDGVLAPYEFGIFSHCIDDEEWDEMVKDKEPLYEGLKSVPILKEFIDCIKEGHAYALFVSGDEWEDKKKFVMDNYNIPEENIIKVSSKDEKLEVLRKFLKENDKYPIAIVEDTVKTLDKIYKEIPQVYTVHVSSFFDE